jgi:hypothetical protein
MASSLEVPDRQASQALLYTGDRKLDNFVRQFGIRMSPEQRCRIGDQHSL